MAYSEAAGFFRRMTEATRGFFICCVWFGDSPHTRMKDTRITLGGKRWTYRRPPRIYFEGGECDGLCDPATKTLKVRKSLAGLPELDANLHEMSHALGSFLDEDFVEATATELAKALWALGYRKLSPDQIKALGMC